MRSRDNVLVAVLASLATLLLATFLPVTWPYGAVLILGLATVASLLVLALLRRSDAADPSDEPTVLLANISHEIRTPLNGILGLTQLLLRMPSTTQQREYLETIKSSGESLLRLISDLLDYANIRAGNLRFDHEAFALRKSIRDTVKTLAPQAHIKGLDIAFLVEPNVPDELEGDPSRLRQVLTNLLTNAIKFTAEGEVLLEVSLEKAEARSAHVHFAVSDTGIGVPSAQRKSIFESFTQAEGTSIEHGGVGLGLAISSDLVERMGGSIELASDEGRGSTFSFTARFERRDAEGMEYEPVPSEPMDGLRVLVIDDSPAVRRVLERQMTAWGFEVLAVDGAAAAAQAVRDERGFSLLLMDSHLPGEDTWSLAERLQADRKMPGILMTFSHEHIDTDLLRSHGFLGHLSKPIAPAHLLRAIEIIRRGATVDGPEDVQTQSMNRLTLGGLNVLLAEDNPVNRTVIVKMLEKIGCDVVSVSNGRSALTALETSLFDLVVLDVEMPELDGVELARAIREKETSTRERLPLVAVTAHVREEDRERCLDAGVDAFLSKPVREEELVAAMQRSLEKAGYGSTDTLVFDKDEALTRANGDTALLAELCGLFLEETPQTLAALVEALRVADCEGVERLAHRLKGSLLTLSARRAADVAYSLECTARTGSSADCDEVLEELRTELDRLEPELLALAAEVKSR